MPLGMPMLPFMQPQAGLIPQFMDVHAQQVQQQHVQPPIYEQKQEP
jgi:hypothetical protein